MLDPVGASGGFERDARAVVRAALRAPRPICRRRGPVVAAERLGELRGLAIADAMGDLAHREPAHAEHLGGPIHPHRGQVLAERRVADLRIRALQLTPAGRHAPRDVVEAEVRCELALDDRRGLLEEARAMTDGGRALHWSVLAVYASIPA